MSRSYERVQGWEADELSFQKSRIKNLGQGFLYLCETKLAVPDGKLSINHVIKGANISYGPRIDSPTIEYFAETAYKSQFLDGDDELGAPKFGEKLILGINYAVHRGEVIQDPNFARYTHADFADFTRFEISVKAYA